MLAAAAPTLVTVRPAAAVRTGVTTTSLTGTLARPQSMAGAITLTGAAPATTYVLVHAFEAVPQRDTGARRLYVGRYRFTFTGCVGGTAAGGEGPEAIIGGAAAPGAPPPSSGAPTYTTSAARTTMRCEYRVAFSGEAPPGPVDSLRAEVWVLQQGTVVSHLDGSPVPAPFPPPVAVPEAPYAALLPALAAALFGMALLLLRRRSERPHGGGAA
jgi:hypothetical protein